MASKILPSAVALTLVVLGIASLAFSREFDSFVKGAFMGAGGMLIVLGVVVLIARFGQRGKPVAGWLPSRDGTE